MLWFTHHHHHHGLQDPEVRALLADIRADLRKLDRIMIDQAALKSAVARLAAADTAMLATLQGVRDDNKNLATQLADVSAKLAALPTDTADLEATINDAVATLNQNADAIEAQVAANPKVPDMPPAAPPTT